MSRVYLEGKESGDGDREFVRLDVTSKTQAERDAILVSLKDYMSGLTAVFTQHTCNHDDGGSCQSVVV